MSTLGRDEILRLAAKAAEHGVTNMELPVTGGVHLAAQGRITMLAGGDKDLVERHRPALEAMGDQIFYMGPLGSAASSRSSPTCWPSSISWPMARR